MAEVNLKAAADEAKAKMGGNNPANLPQREKAERKRIPMTLPQRKLDVPEIPGYVCAWLLNKPARIQQALDAFYEFVEPAEVDLADVRVGADHLSGNTDMGNRVSVLAGSELDEAGQPVRLMLMKVRREYYEEDQAITQERNARVAEELTANFKRGAVGGAAPGETGEDARNRYVDQSRSNVPDLFKPKQRRA